MRIHVYLQEENTKSPSERLRMKQLLDLSPLYIDNSGCNKPHREAVLQSPDAMKDCNNCFSLTPLNPNILPTDSKIMSNIYVTQEEGRSSQSLKKNANEDSCRQQNNVAAMRTKSTFNGNVVTTGSNYQASHQAAVEIPLSVDIVPTSPVTVQSNGISNGNAAAFTKKTSSTSTSSSVDITSPNSLRPVLSKQYSLSDSSCSYRSSTDSLPGPEWSGGRKDNSRSPQSPPAVGSPQSTPTSPSGQKNSEPIYAESTKKKRRQQENELHSQPESPNQTTEAPSPENELSGESHRATITVMAAHTENNRTFYLSSPDSAVSTQCHFSPTARKDQSSPAFRWPSPSHSTVSLATEAGYAPSLHPKPQSSPPIPPKRSTRSPKLGTSSLSPSMSSPVPLPELPKLLTTSLSPSISSPVPLTELPMLFFVSTKDGLKVTTENQSAAPERWHKPHHHSSGWNGRIEEEEEEEERDRKETEKKKLAASPEAASRVTGVVNGAAVWKEARDWKAHSGPPPMTEPGTAPPAATNNGAYQGETKGNGAEAEGKHNGSMPAKQPLHGGSLEPLAAGKGATSNDPHPPPPPPKKLHR